MRLPSALAVFVFALAVYVLLWPLAPVTEGDSAQYLEVARDLVDGRIDALHDRTPGYPVLLALTGSAQSPTRTLFVVSLLLHFASVWMLSAVLDAAGVGKRWVVALIVVLLLPPYVEPAGHVMTENLAQFTLVAGFASLMGWVLRRRMWLVLVAALALAYGTLTRPIYQALAPVLAACLVIVPAARREARLEARTAALSGVVLVAVSMLVLSAYAYTNRTRSGFFGVTHTAGFHLSTKTMPFVERLPDEYAAVREILVRERDVELTKRGGTHTGTQTIWSARSELAEATGLTMPELSRYLFWMNVRLIASAPVEYMQEVARSMAGYWFPAAGDLASSNSRMLRWTWAMLHVLLVAACILQLIVFAGVLLFEASRTLASRAAQVTPSRLRATDVQALAYVLAGAIVFYNMLLSCVIDIGETRQRRPTDALFVFMCVLGVHIWRQSAAAAIEPSAQDTSLARE